MIDGILVIVSSIPREVDPQNQLSWDIHCINKWYLAHLKAYVSNKAQPEGSIAEGNVLEETIWWCSKYLESINAAFSKQKRNDDSTHSKGIYLFKSGGRQVGATKTVRLDEKSMAQAHRYVLLHCEETLKDFQEEFFSWKQEECYAQGIVISPTLKSKWMVEEYPGWLKSQVPNIYASDKDGELKIALACGLNAYATRLSAYILNGYRFHTVERDGRRKTQNSGVMVEADGNTYYGRLTDIYELDYYGTCKVVVFRCNWVDINSPRGLRINNNHPCVNFSKLMPTGRFLKDDPFVFSSQAKQVFYVEDIIEKGWLHIVRNKPRDLYDLGVGSEAMADDIY